MICAIHQPHYFPWLGYFDKLAKADKFAIMDTVQLVPRSYMCRNAFIDKDGNEKTLSVSVDKSNHREKQLREIRVCDIKKTQRSHQDFFKLTYKYAPYKDEVLEALQPVFTKDYTFLIDVVSDTIRAVMRLLDIQTQLVFQSELDYTPASKAEYPEPEARRNLDVLNMCRAMGATKYITGAGSSLAFLKPSSFESGGVELYVQSYKCPEYNQLHTDAFIPNISSLDLLFSCGIEASRKIFKDNMQPDLLYAEAAKRLSDASE